MFMIQWGMLHYPFFILLFFLCLAPLSAYVGPGAGFVFLGSFFFIFAAFFLAFFQILTFPFRSLVRLLRRWRTFRKARFRRVIVIGFDGMDARLFREFQQEGESFPHFRKLQTEGTFNPLWSTEPPISPVAWSTFATGVNPGKHNIFDFLASDRQTYMPKLSVSDIIPGHRSLKLGDWEIPLQKARIELKRKSQSFWSIVSRKGIFSAVLRLPYSFPPETFRGLMLSGLGTPDLRGTQGSFSYFADRPPADMELSDAVWEKLENTGEGVWRGAITGPVHPFRRSRPVLRLPFTVHLDRERKTAEIRFGEETVTLAEGEFSPWKPIRFRAGLLSICGIGQWLIAGLDPLRIYLSPIHIDPERPVMPIAHPKILSVYLAKLLGPFATLGMAEDTWALNGRILSEEQFLAQVYQAQEERERIFFDTEKRVSEGLIVQVFETTDRVQHMFWRYLPRSRSRAERPAETAEVRDAVKISYRRMDEFLGKLLPRIRKNDLLIVVSDHGFDAFDRCFHLNSWLWEQGYLVLNEGARESGKFFAAVDWKRSRAYGIGLNGLYLNQAGRESQGIVRAGAEADDLKREIRDKLLKSVDPETRSAPVREVFLREKIYRGPYVENAPDLIVGYNKGYRVAWESAVNKVGGEVFSDNLRLWSGDHSFTREQVPGIFFCNRKIGEKEPGLIDIAPTVISAFGIPVPVHIEGRDLQIK